MPYIQLYERERLDPLIADLARTIHAPGQLSYAITRLCQAFAGRDFNYAALAETLGVLDCTARELYRRLVAPYEDEKIAQNGDVFGSK